MRVLFLVILYNFFIVSSALQCMDENNKPVDWYIVYKLPKLKHENKLIEGGVGYVYLTSRQPQWTFSKNSINATSSIIANTIQPFYSRFNETTYLLYNDQPPSGESNPSKGHTKGVILTDFESGFWLIHSVPHFPPLTPKYQFSKSGTLKGQSFLCISMDLKNLNMVGVQLQYNEPQIYASFVAPTTRSKISELVKAASGNTVMKPPWYSKVVLNSRENAQFTSFAKAKKFGKDLYEDWVAPVLQSSLLVETWLNGAGRLPSNCTKLFKVYNIEKVSLNTANASFNDSQDHSKWAVTNNSAWICIGDINRMNHQKFRGGGTVCLYNKSLAESYRESVVSMEKCTTLNYF
ncbi:Plancitoxin-1-like Protein [Tribolium castaneum]|uniref:Plancitoxin-1-like Protein n=1 Tax=Tribolium castaneum TaxID=7070 RepID=D2A075_TRICA|nr:PREDICTED: plancitoxin-1 [Tribolium castaneum]EFA02962.2 Plancitoxin-1-like Protein [Tribolium castaneum]|eukprot:XP_008192249.1 PREDICTED: plancitoxin-1 [Tribolium castaneum]